MIAVGLVATRDSKRIVLTKAVLKYRAFFTLLRKYVDCHYPAAKFKHRRFPFTSININHDFACRPGPQLLRMDCSL